MDWLTMAVDGAVSRLHRLAVTVLERADQHMLPHVAESGTWVWRDARIGGHWSGEDWSHGSWTGGYVAGQLWLAARARGQDDQLSQLLEEAAHRVIDVLRPRAVDGSTHDVGFLFWPSAVIGHLATGEPELRALALRAAETLQSRAHPSGILQSWGELDHPLARGASAIDTMMNLPLLWWAAEEGLEGAREAAVAHVRRTAAGYVRPDGTTVHVVRFADDGAVVSRGTHQGYADDSCWSRGQAWAVHGFVDAYRRTGEAEFGELAIRTVQAFLARCESGEIVPYDFDHPEPSLAAKDASAMAIVASALLRVHEFEPERRWLAAAESLMTTLVEHAVPAADEDGLLGLTTYSVPHAEGVDGSATWGDFFYLRSLLELRDGTLHLDV